MKNFLKMNINMQVKLKSAGLEIVRYSLIARGISLIYTTPFFPLVFQPSHLNQLALHIYLLL